VSIRQLAALDARRRPDALDRRHAPQGGQTLRRQRAQRAPGALELIEFGDDVEHLGLDDQGLCVERVGLKSSQIQLEIQVHL